MARAHGVNLTVALAALALGGAGCGGGLGDEPVAGEAARAEARSAALAQADVCLDGDPACTPTGAHAAHAAFACTVCHKVAGRLAFDRSGPAYRAGLGTPSFDATAKTCANVACHGMPAGTFSYTTWDWANDQPLTVTVTYGGTSRASPSWYAAGGARCTACHDDPPRNGSSGSNYWHSGQHGNQAATGALNQCQLCHPDATSPGTGVGDTITDAALHANGAVDVAPQFASRCFGCH